MDRIVLAFSLLLCCTVVQGLVCNQCNVGQLCQDRNRNTTCVATERYPFCYTIAIYEGNLTFSHYGCANFEPCTSWEPILDQGRTYIKKCCNTDHCNGIFVVDANRPATASA